MPILKEFLKFIFFEEVIPYKNETYIWRAFSFREAMLTASAREDRKTLWQFRCLFPMILILLAHQMYLYRGGLTEVESYIEIDYLAWVGLPTLINICISLFLLVVLYYLHVYYCSPIADSHIRSIVEILWTGRLSEQHWPFHYKYQDCTLVARKCLLQMLFLLQSLIVNIGKYI